MARADTVPDARRARGSGSIVSKPDGTYVGFLSLGTDPATGRRLRATVTGPTEQEVEAKLLQLQHKTAKGLDVVGAKQQLGPFLDHWHSTLRPRPQGHYSPSTLAGYRKIIDGYLKPSLGHLTLERLQARGGALHIERFQNALLDLGLASQTVLNARNCLRGALSYAVRMGLIETNPVVRVTAPPASRYEGQTLDERGARALLRTIAGHRFEVGIWLELMCGLRRAEVLGLQWKHLQDLDARPGDPRRRPRLHVRQERLWVKGRGLVVQEPKTKRSRRTLFLPEVLVRKLLHWRQLQELDPIAPGQLVARGGQGYVLTNPDGTLPAPNTFTRNVKDCLMRAGLPPEMRGHDLRHSFSSILQAEGMPASGAMAALGHSSLSMTMGTYTHTTDPLRSMAAQIFDDLVERAGTDDA